MQHQLPSWGVYGEESQGPAMLWHSPGGAVSTCGCGRQGEHAEVADCVCGPAGTEEMAAEKAPEGQGRLRVDEELQERHLSGEGRARGQQLAQLPAF